MHEVEVAQPIQVKIPAQYQHGDLVEFGNDLAAMGIGATESRGLIEAIQAIVTGAVMASIPDIMKRVRDIQQQRLRRLQVEVQTLPTMMGYVSRDAVLARIANVTSEVPRI